MQRRASPAPGETATSRRSLLARNPYTGRAPSRAGRLYPGDASVRDAATESAVWLKRAVASEAVRVVEHAIAIGSAAKSPSRPDESADAWRQSAEDLERERNSLECDREEWERERQELLTRATTAEASVASKDAHIDRMIADLEDATAASMAQLEQMKDEHEHDRAALEEEVARLRTQLEEEGARAREFAETCQTLAAAVEDSEKV